MGQKVFLSFLLLCVISTAGGGDLLREQRIAAEVEAAIQTGKPVRLQAGDVEFMAIYAGAESDVIRGGVIILHGQGAHPDWPDVIHPLRTELPLHGWETLSIQMPIAAADAPEWVYNDLVSEALPRIKAAVEYFKQGNFSTLMLVAHDLGARMGAEYLASGTAEAEEINAFVAIGMAVQRKSPGYEALKKIKIPLLDIYGSRDLDAVLKGGRDRAAAAREGLNKGFRQVVVPGADHLFRGLQDTLVNRVQSWMRKVSPEVTFKRLAE